MKLTREQLQGRQKKAVRFVRDVLGDPDRAEEIANESLEHYAARRKIRLINPSKRRNGIMPTKEELEDRIDELEQENQALQDQLDTIADIVAPQEEDGCDEGGDDGEEDDGQD